MNKDQLQLLQPGTEIYFCAIKGYFVRVLNDSVTINIAGFNDFVVREDRFELLFQASPTIQVISNEFIQQTDAYFKSAFVPKNLDEKAILLSYWKDLCVYSDDMLSSSYIETKGNLAKRLEKITRILQLLDELSIDGTPFFAKNTPTISKERHSENFIHKNHSA